MIRSDWLFFGLVADRFEPRAAVDCARAAAEEAWMRGELSKRQVIGLVTILAKWMTPA